MSRRVELHLDYGAIGGVLRSDDVARIVRGKADEVAANLRNGGAARTFVEEYTTDRAAAAVNIVDWNAAHELKYGDVFDAAAAAGLEVHRG